MRFTESVGPARAGLPGGAGRLRSHGGFEAAVPAGRIGDHSLAEHVLDDQPDGLPKRRVGSGAAGQLDPALPYGHVEPFGRRDADLADKGFRHGNGQEGK